MFGDDEAINVFALAPAALVRYVSRQRKGGNISITGHHQDILARKLTFN